MARGYGVMTLLQQRLELESALISVEEDLEYNTKIYDTYGDYAHKHVVNKLITHLLSLREEYKLFGVNHTKEQYPEIWI